MLWLNQGVHVLLGQSNASANLLICAPHLVAAAAHPELREAPVEQLLQGATVRPGTNVVQTYHHPIAGVKPDMRVRKPPDRNSRINNHWRFVMLRLSSKTGGIKADRHV